MDRNELLLKLSQMNFTALDLQLYLDTHPTEKRAIEQYNMAVNEANKLRAEYESMYGPLASFVTPSDPAEFTYINEPWPWQKS